VVHAQEGLLEEGGHPGPQVGLGLQHLALRHTGFEERLNDLGPVPVRLDLSDLAQAVPAGTEPPLDHHGVEAGQVLELDHRYDRELVLPDVVARLWLREPNGLPDHLQQLQRNARPFAQLAEGRAADPGEPIERAGIQEGERESPVPNGGGHPVERHAGPLEALHPSGPPHVTRREDVTSSGSHDPQLDQAIDVVDVDAGPPGDLLARIPVHEMVMVDGLDQDIAVGGARGDR
jgi:hypothetical protein